jgi:acetylornithine deacetylase/succinyl-diaminopimelate desuccinylase-like protein
VVVARDHGAGPALPTVLYYGHYDVQPPDPLDEWRTGPFDPVLEDGPHGRRIVARGAADDKGQLMTFIEAFRAWKKAAGRLPVNVTVMLEGEEESGSPSLIPFLEGARADLAADVCVVSDTGMWDIDTPAVTYMLRGLVYLEATLHGPGHDLHSGMYGGCAVNPNNALAAIVAQLHDARRRVTIEGFYDEVAEISAEERAMWERLDFDEAAFLATGGLAADVGEAGRSLLERIWARPACDCNGIWGGYTGDGAKTVIPARAAAKVSCRLVAAQRAERIMAGLQKFFTDRTPPGCRFTFKTYGCSDAVRVPTDSPWLAAARAGLREAFGRQAVLIGTGGSIPVVGEIRRVLGIDSLLVGFGLDDDRVHSPNEKFELACFRRGIQAQAAMLGHLAAVARNGAATG